MVTSANLFRSINTAGQPSDGGESTYYIGGGGIFRRTPEGGLTPNEEWGPAKGASEAARAVGDYLSTEEEQAAIKKAAEDQAKAREADLKAFLEATSGVAGLFAPFREAGAQALPTQAGFQEGGAAAFQAQQALAGLLGPEAQQAAIAQLQASPQFQALAAQGEQAILSNAAATGGVRGGNTQAALAQFRPQLLSGLINQQYQQLMGMSGLGANVGQGLVSAGLQGAGGEAGATMNRAGTAADISGEAGAARAGGTLGALAYGAQGEQRIADIISGILGTAGKLGTAMFMPTG